MKSILLTLLLPVWTFAQSVDVKSIDAGDSENTTIQIQKGAKAAIPPLPPKWEIQDGTTDLEGETSATAREAKAAWKTACANWKKEFREENKDNKVLSTNCGTAECSGEAGSKICTSKATYKVKTRMD